jgi:hypothetical protein
MSYSLQHNTTKSIAKTPIAHYDFTKLSGTVGQPISAVPNQAGGLALEQNNTNHQPTLQQMTTASGDTYNVATFIRDSSGDFLLVDLPTGVGNTSSEPFTLIAVCTTQAGSEGDGILEVRNPTHASYNSISIRKNYGRFSAGEKNLFAYMPDNASHTPNQLNFVEAQYFEADSTGPHHGITISCQMNIDASSSLLSGGEVEQSLNQYAGPYSRLTVGRRTYNSTTDTNGSIYPYEGKIAEVFVFDDLLTETDRQTIRDYVQEKYDIQRKGLVGSKCLELSEQDYAVVDCSTTTTGPEARSQSHVLETGLRRPYNYFIDTWFMYTGEHRYGSDSGRYGQILSLRSENRTDGGGISLRLDRNYPYMQLYAFGLSHNIGNVSYIPVHKWMHIRFGIDYIENKIKLWIDGELKAEVGNYTTNYWWLHTPSDIILGMCSDQVSKYWQTQTDSATYTSCPGKHAGVRLSTTAEPLTSIVAAESITTMPSTTTGGDFLVDREDMGLYPLYESIVTTEDTNRFPLIHGTYKQTASNVFGTNLILTNRYMPDVRDIENPDLINSFVGSHLYLAQNGIKTLYPLRDLFEDGRLNGVNSNHLRLENNRIESLVDMKGSTFLSNGRWYTIYLDNNPLVTDDGIQELNACVQFHMKYVKTLTSLDYIDQAEWPGCNTFNISNCYNLQTITPSAFKGMPALGSIYMTGCRSLTTAPVLRFDGQDQSTNSYYINLDGCNMLDFSPLESDRLSYLITTNQVHENEIDLSFLTTCSWLYRINAGGNNYSNNTLPDFSNSRLYWAQFDSTNIEDLTFLTTAVKPGYNVLGANSSTDALYDTMYLYNMKLSAGNMVTLGNDSSKKISVMDELQINNNPELNDLRVFSKSFSFPVRSSWYNGNVSHHRAYLNNCNLTDTANSIGSMKHWWQCCRLELYHNPNLTSLNNLFTNSVTATRDQYYDSNSFSTVGAQNCAINDVSWMLNTSFAGVKHINLSYNPIDYQSWANISSQLIALKNAGDIRLETVNMIYTAWDNKHCGGGYWYIYYPTNNSTIKSSRSPGRTPTGEVDPVDGWVYTAPLTASEYFRCTSSGTGTSLSPQAQLHKDLADAGIKLSFTGVGSNWNHANGTYYHPHGLPGDPVYYGTSGPAYVCPIPHPPINA